jgi:hypothetical protein
MLLQACRRTRSSVLVRDAVLSGSLPLGAYVGGSRITRDNGCPVGGFTQSLQTAVLG